ncbi:hypothetical protein BU25DRAFT_80420 [Macroventuria anomochaeta]|uniref:Uncharacterized protein n=1 Tax=Macroventuria anomochaeta TaxID=301207 RepID=A0ACB6SEN5_9PLEO|nr:uncharacterized protein BU25DRAFT_80420 [Macroventuria anomochaeta]KAF2632686.1 hypothetical protein BU25DRAFT_80420 [Macroventuria anomochaeta]
MSLKRSTRSARSIAYDNVSVNAQLNVLEQKYPHTEMLGSARSCMHATFSRFEEVTRRNHGECEGEKFVR